MSEQDQINSLRSALAKLQNHNVMIVEANKRLAEMLAEVTAMNRELENNNLRMIIEETRPK
tara:strand:- start:34 stop:216 length:183 start_codon:yes stop_codon:yes gene_type:complete